MSTEVTSYRGRPFVYPTGSQVGEAIAGGREWDHVLRGLLPSLIDSPEPVVVDVGSNIGASLLQILEAKPRARVFSFEPSDRFRAYQEYNLGLGGFTHVEVSPCLVGRTAGEGFIHTDGKTSGANRAMPHLGESQPAVVTTLDDACSDAGPVSFIKTDTDGNDLEVLAGAERVLRRDKPVLFVELAPAIILADPIAQLTWLQSLGYERLAYLAWNGWLVGVTHDPTEIVEWARENGYCDIVSCADATPAASKLDSYLAGLVRLPGG